MGTVQAIERRQQRRRRQAERLALIAAQRRMATQTAGRRVVRHG